MTRLLSALSFTFLLAACSSDGPATFTGPSGSLPPSPPAPSTTTFNPRDRVWPGTLGLIGSVTDAITGRDLGSDSVNAWVQQSDGFGYSYWWARGSLRSDTSGRFELTQLPESVDVIINVVRTGYVQQCAHPTITIRGNASVNIRLVPNDRISSSSSFTVDPPGFRSVSGMVFEKTADGRRPVAGAYVSYEPVLEYAAATTITDADGRYLLCGIPLERQAPISAYAVDGRNAFATALAGATALDVEFR